jgi:hypothetical protein
VHPGPIDLGTINQRHLTLAMPALNVIGTSCHC